MTTIIACTLAYLALLTLALLLNAGASIVTEKLK